MNSTSNKTIDSDEDPVTLMLQKTGCIDLHYKVQVIFINSTVFIKFYMIENSRRIN